MKSIRVRLGFSYIGLTLLTLLLTGGVFLGFAGHWARQMNMDSLEGVASEIVPLLDDCLYEDRAETGAGSRPSVIFKPDAFMTTRFVNESISWRFIPFPSRMSFRPPHDMSAYQNGMVPPETDKPIFRIMKRPPKRSGPGLEELDGRYYFRVPVWTTLASGQTAGGIVEFSRSVQVLSPVLEQAFRGFLLAASIAVMVAVVLALLVSLHMVRPIKELSARVQSLSPGEDIEDFTLKAPRELEELAGTVRFMGKRLSGSFRDLSSERDSLKNFLADASHELRSPLTAMRTSMELLAGNAGKDQSRRDAYIQLVAGQIDRMEHVVSRLLHLTRLDGGIHGSTCSLTDVRDLVGRMVERYRLQGSGVKLVFSAEDCQADCRAWADAAALELVLDNVVGNSVKYGASSITLSVQSLQQTIRLLIEDDGCGVHGDDVARLGERFFRARPANGKELLVEGLGIGLALSQGMLKGMGAQMSFAPNLAAQSGLQVCIELQAQNPAGTD